METRFVDPVLREAVRRIEEEISMKEFERDEFLRRSGASPPAGRRFQGHPSSFEKRGQDPWVAAAGRNRAAERVRERRERARTEKAVAAEEEERTRMREQWKKEADKQRKKKEWENRPYKQNTPSPETFRPKRTRTSGTAAHEPSPPPPKPSYGPFSPTGDTGPPDPFSRQAERLRRWQSVHQRRGKRPPQGAEQAAPASPSSRPTTGSRRSRFSRFASGPSFPVNDASDDNSTASEDGGGFFRSPPSPRYARGGQTADPDGGREWTRQRFRSFAGFTGFSSEGRGPGPPKPQPADGLTSAERAGRTHELAWRAFEGSDAAILRWGDIPWPIALATVDAVDIVLEAVRVALADAGESEIPEKSLWRLALKRWHPDKFLQTYGMRLWPADHDRVAEGVKNICQALTAARDRKT